MSPIRSASVHDLPGAYRVCLQTGDSGRDATALYRNPDLLGHIYVGPYIVGQPDLAMIVADGEGVGGYLLAAADTRAFEAWAARHWWPVLREQYAPREGTMPDDAPGSGPSPDDELVRIIHAPPTAPESIVTDYPAHLHVDLLARARGQGLGRLLVERLLATLGERRSPGVHLGVAADNPSAIAFYRHLGFVELERRTGSILLGMRLR